MTVWSIADVTRERERQENVFQELQHAIDYLDHAPAGFFSVDAAGDIVYLNATLAAWLDHDLAQVGSGALKLADIVAGEGAALLTTLAAAPGEVKTEVLDLDLKTRSGKPVPVRLFHKVAFGADGAAGRLAHAGAQPRAATTAATRSAPPKCASCASSTTRRWRSPPSTRHGKIARSNARFALRPFEGGAQGRRPLDPRRRRRARPRRARSRDPPGGRRAERDRAGRRRARRARRALGRFFVLGGRGRGATARPRSSMRSRPPSSARWRTSSTSSRRWNRSASSPAASRTTSTTCSPPS